MIISAIVAVGENNVMGRNNDIPWYLPADLKYFKKTTLNSHIIMGRKTFESIGKPLPKRTNIIVTRQPFFLASGCISTHSIEQALQTAQDNGVEEVFIIGGGEIYKQSEPYWNRLYLTKVDVKVEDGDTFFPEIDFSEWTESFSEQHQANEKNEYDYSFHIYERKES